MTARTLASLAAAFCPIAIVAAQIAPPPTEAPAPATPYKRPPVIMPKPAEPARTPRENGSRVELPNLPYESLVKKDAQGKVIRLTEPVTWAACRRNPTITKEDWAKLEPVFRERRAECENIAVKNLDLMEKVEAGEIERIEGDAKTIVQTIRSLFAPLRPSGGDFCSKLGKEGTLTEVQSAFSQKIEGEYNAAVRAELRAGMKPKQDASQIGSIDIVRHMFYEQIDETIWCYRELLAEAAGAMDRALPKVSPGIAAKVSAEQRALAAATDAAARPQLLRALLDKLDLQERRALLSAVIESRPKAPAGQPGQAR